MSLLLRTIHSLNSILGNSQPLQFVIFTPFYSLLQVSLYIQNIFLSLTLFIHIRSLPCHKKQSKSFTDTKRCFQILRFNRKLTKGLKISLVMFKFNFESTHKGRHTILIILDPLVIMYELSSQNP